MLVSLVSLFVVRVVVVFHKAEMLVIVSPAAAGGGGLTSYMAATYQHALLLMSLTKQRQIMRSSAIRRTWYSLLCIRAARGTTRGTTKLELEFHHVPGRISDN